MESKTITKKQISQVLQTNTTGVKFANKSLQRKFEKNKKLLERNKAIEENIRKRSAKAADASASDITVAMVANLSKHTDQELLSAIIGLGMTITDLIDGKVDAVRALRLVKQAEKLVAERMQNVMPISNIQVQQPIPPIAKINS